LEISWLVGACGGFVFEKYMISVYVTNIVTNAKSLGLSLIVDHQCQ
jgi:hypothetical protein